MKRAKTLVEKELVTKRLLALWQANPELRLAQLIQNVYHNEDIYNVEDEDFIETLEWAYKGFNLKRRRNGPI